MSTEQLLTVAEAARELGISQRALLNRIERGDIPAQRLGARLWVLSRAEVDRRKGEGRLRTGPKPGTRRKQSAERGGAPPKRTSNPR